MGLIQTYDQLTFSYEAIIEGMRRMNNGVSREKRFKWIIIIIMLLLFLFRLMTDSQKNWVVNILWFIFFFRYFSSSSSSYL
jgi:predicted membrane protein